MVEEKHLSYQHVMFWSLQVTETDIDVEGIE